MIKCAHVWVCVCWHTCTKSGDNFQESVLFYLVGPGVEFTVCGLAAGAFTHGVVSSKRSSLNCSVPNHWLRGWISPFISTWMSPRPSHLGTLSLALVSREVEISLASTQDDGPVTQNPNFLLITTLVGGRYFLAGADNVESSVCCGC